MKTYPAAVAAVQHLFDPDLPNSPALWAVLKGNYGGEVLVDDPREPTQCAVRTYAALTYFSRNTEQFFLDAAIAYFRGIGPVWLVWPHRTVLVPPGGSAAEDVPRLEFWDASPDTLSELRSRLPEGYSIQAIDAELLSRCEWRDEMVYYAGSERSFLAYGVGLCMMNGDEIIVEAYASALGQARAEIGAITREAYRGRGYAPVACAYLAEMCAQRGYQPYWSCDADNLASVRVAEKLGFRHSRSYQIFEYAQVGMDQSR